MDRPEPSEVKQARDTFGITPVRLDRHGLRGAFHLAGFHQDDVQTRMGQSAVQPLRQRTSLEASGGDDAILLSNPAHKRLGLAGDLRLFHDLAMLADHADCRRPLKAFRMAGWSPATWLFSTRRGIQFCLTIRVLFELPLRQTTGTVASLLKMADLDWAVPDYTTLC